MTDTVLKLRKASSDSVLSDDEIAANEWIARFIKYADSTNGYWSNTVVIPDGVLRVFIEKGLRVFNRNPIYCPITGYPLQLIYWGEGSPNFQGFNMVELN